jgi:tripartite-type tricarboxylate transporter receptor subunit TctC
MRSVARRSVVLGIGASPLLAMGAHAQGAWPSQSIRLVVPFAPGGTTDLVARLIAAGLQEKLGVSIVVENRAGIASHAISPAVYGNKVRYDPVKDFAHIALVVSNPTVWVANPRAGIRTMADVAARAKSAGGLQVATSGAGSSNHLLVVQMSRQIGTEITHVPFRGAGPAMQAVIAGQVPMMSDSLPSAASHIKQGSVIAVGMCSAERHPSFPDVPTFREQGFPLESDSWFGLSAPAGTPVPIVERLNRDVLALLQTAEIRNRFAELGGTPGTYSAADYSSFIIREVAKWAPLVQAAGATAD